MNMAAETDQADALVICRSTVCDALKAAAGITLPPCQTAALAGVFADEALPCARSQTIESKATQRDSKHLNHLVTLVWI